MVFKKGDIPFNKGKKLKPFTKLHRLHMSIAQMGHKVDENTKQKLYIANKGKIVSVETRLKLSKIHKGRISCNKGKILSDEIRNKMAKSHIGLHPSKETRELMKKKRLFRLLPLKDTFIEKQMQQELIRQGIQFQKHKAILGQPDIFIEPNVCIFCDGDYWHGNPSLFKSDKILCGNICVADKWKKDKLLTQKLEEKGYQVFRFWESEIKQSSFDCVNEVLEKMECE